jgi:hypothetical protein
MMISNLITSIPRAAGIISLALLAACSSAGKTEITTPKILSIKHEATASLVVKSSTRKPNKYQSQIEQLLRKDLALGLVSAGIFKSVSKTSIGVDYQIDLRIEKIRVISAGQRIWLGVFSGRSYVQVFVDVRQTNQNRIVSSFRTTGYGARTAIGAQSYGYDDPVREVVAHVIHSLQ